MKEIRADGQIVLDDGRVLPKEYRQFVRGGITDKHILRLCDNLNPQTGERLTRRQNTTRVEVDDDGKLHKAANRRVFFDFTLSPPKSVSIAALVGDDRRIVEAHDEAAIRNTSNDRTAGLLDSGVR